MNDILITILETGDVQRYRALCEYGGINMLYFLLVFFSLPEYGAIKKIIIKMYFFIYIYHYFNILRQ